MPIRTAPDLERPRLPDGHLARASASCKYYPSCSQYAIDALQRVRGATWVGLGGVALAALQPVELRRLRSGGAAEPCSAAGSGAARRMLRRPGSRPQGRAA